MRVTTCDACGIVDAAAEPVGWIFVAVFLEEEADRLAGFLGGGTSHRKQRAYVVCSPQCLAAFAELEAVR